MLSSLARLHLVQILSTLALQDGGIILVQHYYSVDGEGRSRDIFLRLE